MHCVNDRYSKAKSFFIRSEAVYLYEFYILLGISFGKTEINNATVADIAALNPFMVLVGGGGSGKSMLMRHLFLDTLKSGEKVPVFLELRHLDEQNQTLLDFIKETLRLNKLKLDEDYVEKAMKAGHFVLLLDGFDEIVRSHRKELSKQIQQLQKKYDKNMMFVSSRADDVFSGWAAFSEARVSPLNLDQAVRLVTKLPFDNEIKNKFIKDLQTKLFEQHKSFLSNPLLLSIMLLTYSQSADIPNKLSVFYSQAYEALYQRHDALKGGFQRERLSNLDIQDFARVFSAFAIQSYDDRKFSMTKSDALDYLEKAKKLTGIEVDAEDYLADAHQAVSLLVEEGLFLSFTHRSFQEYFAAKFISELEIEQQRSLLKKYKQYIRRDEVFNLLYEMKPDLMEKEFIIPSITELQERLEIRDKIGLSHFLKYLKLHFSTVTFNAHAIFLSNHNGISVPILLDSALYALYHNGHLLSPEESAKNNEMLLIEKYNKDKDEVAFKVDDLTIKSELLADLAYSENYFAIKSLENLFAIKKLLIKKHEGANNSLSQILKI